MEELKRAASLIEKASIILVMAGAGMSAESGLKTYEEINQESLGSGKEYADFCDPDCLKDTPLEFWKFWGASAADYQRVQPHKGYHILRKWRDRLKQKIQTTLKYHLRDYFQSNYENYSSDLVIPDCFFVYTSNVDGLFRKSGIPSSDILEIHGNASLLQCAQGITCQSKTWPLSVAGNVANEESLPRCDMCGRVCRPYVLMFNDEEWLGLENCGTSNFSIYDIWEEGIEEYLRNHDTASLVILELGCGDRVPVVKMESETVLGDVTNVLTDNGTKSVDNLSTRLALIRINVKQSSFLDYHEKWSEGNSHIDSSTILCLEGECGDVLEAIDHCME